MATIIGTQVSAPIQANELTRLEFRGTDGSVAVFTDHASGFITLPGSQGLGMMPYQLLTDSLPALDGEVSKGVRSTARELFVPLYVEAPNRPAFLTKVRDLANTLDPRYGPGEFRVVQPDGSGRRIPCYYVNGLEGDEGVDVSGLHWQKFGLAFRALEPAWLDLNDVYFRWLVGSDAPFFPILPLTLSESQIIGTDLPLTNTGDEPAYPIWRITGRCTQIQLTNVTTGATLLLDHTQVNSANHVTIDTRPGIKTVLDEAGTNLWPSLGPDPQLWPLIRGTNVVNLTVVGTDVTSYIEMSYTPRYKMAA